MFHDLAAILAGIVVFDKTGLRLNLNPSEKRNRLESGTCIQISLK